MPEKSNPLDVWGGVDLDRLYANARCLTDAAYRRWIDTLSGFLLGGCEHQRNEAIRRIEYIETELLSRPLMPWSKWQEQRAA